MLVDTKYDLFLDAKGMSCPYPVLKTRKAVKDLVRDQVLKVETTDPASKSDVPSWVRSTGNELIRLDEIEGVFTFFIRKTS